MAEVEPCKATNTEKKLRWLLKMAVDTLEEKMQCLCEVTERESVNSACTECSYNRCCDDKENHIEDARWIYRNEVDELLRNEQRKIEIEWIPVSKGFPAGQEDVLATVHNKRTGESVVWHAARIVGGWAISDCSNYREIYDADDDAEIIAWAFLPKPYKESEREWTKLN